MDASGNPQSPTEDYSDPIQLSNLLDLSPNQRITINGDCYNINDIYQWVITQNHNTDPKRILVSENDKRRIRNAYNVLHMRTNNPERIRFLRRVRENGLFLQVASPELQNDREIVLEAIRQNNADLTFILSLALPQLRNDREIILEAVRQDGWLLTYASPELRNDREIVLAALRRRW